MSLTTMNIAMYRSRMDTPPASGERRAHTVTERHDEIMRLVSKHRGSNQ